jgi:YihY family inner membrane protein
MPHDTISRLDGYQRGHRWIGLPLGVLYKFFDDQGGYLTALITYYGFLSLFPLLLLFVTVLGFALHGDAHLQDKLLSSALAQFPVVGSQLRESVHAEGGSGLGLVIGIGGTLYGCLGFAQATQNAFNRIWGVPRNRRPNPVRSRARSLLLLLVLGLGVLVTTALSGVTAGAGQLGAHVHSELRIAGTLLGVLVNFGLFLLAFRVLTAPGVPRRDLRLGAAAAAVGWQAAQLAGAYFVTHKLKGTSEAYGVFGLVLGLVAWIYVLALVTVLSAEINVVVRRHLWPRALLTPFTDHVRLTDADQRTYTRYAQTERHKGFQVVNVDFQDADQQAPNREQT